MIRIGSLALVIGAVLSSPVSAQSELVARGDYLVNGILTCGNCHTPKGPSGEIRDKAFSGGASWDQPPFKVTASNITQDKETGIGNYTDAELRQLLRKGVKRNGARVAMIMPSGFYEIMTDRDLDAVIAYLRTIKPIRNAVPEPVYKMAQEHPVPPGGESPYTEAVLSDKVQQGFYLVTIAHCMECHTPMGPQGREFATSMGAGGGKFTGPWGVSVSRNISSSKTNKALAVGLTTRSNARSLRASARTAASSIRRWASITTPLCRLPISTPSSPICARCRQRNSLKAATRPAEAHLRRRCSRRRPPAMRLS
ncbi:mono/diheme cytochrome c family protein [Bradyrhizobium sp. USDA 4341]